MNNLSAVESVFFAALDKGSPEERAAYAKKVFDAVDSEDRARQGK